MSMQVRVLVEVGAVDGQPPIRLERTETVIPANPDPNDYTDLAALSSAVLSRLVEECGNGALRQIEQWGHLMASAKGRS